MLKLATCTAIKPCFQNQLKPLQSQGFGLCIAPGRIISTPLGHTKSIKIHKTRLPPPAAIPLPSPTSAAEPTAVSWLSATGVPLLTVLSTFPLKTAIAFCAVLLFMTYLLVKANRKFLKWAETRATYNATEEVEEQPLSGLIFRAAISAVYTPGSLLLPWWGIIYGSKIVAVLADLLIQKIDVSSHIIPRTLAAHTSVGVQLFCQILQDSSELVLLLFFSWFLINWKDQILSYWVIKSGGKMRESLERAVSPLSTLSTWAICAFSLISAAQLCGFNTQPLLALGGAGTIAAGLAAQSTAQNLVGALSLYTAPPFVVGDIVQLKTLTNVIVADGCVEKILPMRTIIKCEDGSAVFISNKDVMSLVVINQTALKGGKRQRRRRGLDDVSSEDE